MTTSANLSIEHMVSGEVDKETTFNDLVDMTDKVTSRYTTYTVSVNATLTASEAAFAFIEFIGAPGAERTITLPTNKKYTFKNSTTGGFNVVVSGAGAGPQILKIPPGGIVQVFQKDDNELHHTGGRGPITRYKTADQTLIGTAFADVSELGFHVEANTAYAFEFCLLVDADALTTGIDVAVNGPAAPTLINYTQEYWTSVTVRAVAGAIAYDNNTASTASNGTTLRMFYVYGIIRNGANAGTLFARTKREAVGTGPNVRTGSYGTLTRLN